MSRIADNLGFADWDRQPAMMSQAGRSEADVRTCQVLRSQTQKWQSRCQSRDEIAKGRSPAEAPTRALPPIRRHSQKLPQLRRPGIDPPDPVDAIKYRMEQAGLGQADLARLLGSRSRASEIMRRKRSLTMEQALKLNEEWKIPAEALLRPSLKETA